MSSPWLKKNPFMSLWLSGANNVMGRARGQASAAIKREADQAGAAVAAAAARQVTDFWTRTLTQPPAPVPARKRRTLKKSKV